LRFKQAEALLMASADAIQLAKAFLASLRPGSNGKRAPRVRRWARAAVPRAPAGTDAAPMSLSSRLPPR